MLSCCVLDFSVGVRSFVIGLSQISSFSLNFYISLHNYFEAEHLCAVTNITEVSLTMT